MMVKWKHTMRRGWSSCAPKGTRLPKYSDRRGWRGGDSHTLYTFEDKRTGQLSVRPGGGVRDIGGEVHVRVATRAEAKKHWQEDLHPGWKIACRGRR